MTDFQHNYPRKCLFVMFKPVIAQKLELNFMELNEAALAVSESAVM
jgi:hypothetical protein